MTKFKVIDKKTFKNGHFSKKKTPIFDPLGSQKGVKMNFWETSTQWWWSRRYTLNYHTYLGYDFWPFLTVPDFET